MTRTEVITCTDCGKDWQRPVKRGRKPRRCARCKRVRKRDRARARTTTDHPVQAWIQRLSDGETLESIGDDVGLSRERVRQVVTAEAPHKPWVAVRRERKVLREEAEWGRRKALRDPCPICGGEISLSRITYCSNRCQEFADRLRTVIDEEKWRRHREQVSRWVLENGRGSEEHATKVLDGRTDEIEPQGPGRWLVPGSENHRLALEAFEKGWPIVEQFHPAIRQQLEREVAG